VGNANVKGKASMFVVSYSFVFAEIQISGVKGTGIGGGREMGEMINDNWEMRNEKLE